MEDNIFIYIVSSNYIASSLMAVPKSIYPELSEKLKPKSEECKYVITRQFDHLLSDSYKFYSYRIFDSTFSPIIRFNGIYRLSKNEFKETWEGKWNNRILIFSFESDMFDKFELKVSTIGNHLKTIQQIAFILEMIDNKSTKLTVDDAAAIRFKLDNYLNVKKI